MRPVAAPGCAPRPRGRATGAAAEGGGPAGSGGGGGGGKKPPVRGARLLREVRRLLDPRARKNAALFASWGLAVGCGVWAFGRFRTPVCPELPYSSFFRLAQVKKIERVAFEEAARAGAPHWVYFNVKKRVDLAKELGLQVEGKAGPFRARRPGPDNIADKLLRDGVVLRSMRASSGTAVAGAVLYVLCFGAAISLAYRVSMARFQPKKSFQTAVGEDVTCKFEDVRGLGAIEGELREVVEFLEQPEKFRSMNAKLPAGVLLCGPPGTGKTLLARAVTGEAGVPFFAVSGSEFLELFVGLGAARVRQLFEGARKAAPCIIFIDEIDAIGGRRGGIPGGSNNEREQTLNQLLTEIDSESVRPRREVVED